MLGIAWLWQDRLPQPFAFGEIPGRENRSMAGQITAIQAQKRNPRRASVFVDGQFAFGLAMIEAARLSKGQYLTDDDIAALQAADEQERAYEQALSFLSYRPRSSAEVTRRLQEKGFAGAVVDAVLERLSRSGLIDDEAFARYWIANRDQFNPRGARALRYELQQKGVSNRIVDALLEEVDDAENAYRVAAERLARWGRMSESQRPDPVALRRRLSGYLQRRGFSYAIIQEVWERIEAERAADQIDLEESEDATWDLETSGG